MRTVTEIIEIIRAGLGELPCDIKLENVKLVNVFSGEIYPTSIYIKGKRIISIDPDAELKAHEIVDCGGMFAVPGLIDSHMHFETTMLSPEALSEIVVPKGTTTLCADLMEIANVAGAEGLKAMLTSIDRLPCRIVLEVPSRVPTAPGLETTGATLGSKEVSEIMGWEEAVSLGELDPSKILFVKEDYIKKIEDTLNRRKIVNGHAIGRLGQELNVYASSGISDDHECVDAEEMVERLRVGMKVLIREGSTERNLDDLIRGVVKENLPIENLCFCTDDKHPNEIDEEGHICYNVKRSQELGLSAMDAIKIATVNAAKHFRIEDEIGSITPGRLADILIIPDLQKMLPEKVFFEGKLVVDNHKMLERIPVAKYPEWIRDTVHLKKPITEDRFYVPTDKQNGTVLVRVIDMIERQIVNKEVHIELPVNNHIIMCDPDRDILRLAVVERYGKTGGIGNGFVRGFNLKKGALAFSTSHDHHNIVVVGADEKSMVTAVNEIVRLHGGCAVADGTEIVDSMALPIGGLISDKAPETVMKEIDRLNTAALTLGCRLPAPFMALSFVSLPTVPELGLTDMGLVGVLEHKLIGVEV